MKRRIWIIWVISFFICPAVSWTQEADSVPARVSRLEKILGKLPKISGFINLRYQYDGADGSNSFDVRRARIDIQGDIIPKLDYRLQVEFAGTPKILDAYVRWKMASFANLQVGQFKLPFTLENPYAPTALETIDNSQVIDRFASYNDVSGIKSNGRDIGISLSGSFFKREGYNVLEYNAGVFNGNGINNLDMNKKKAFAGTLSVTPARYFTLAGFYYNGTTTDKERGEQKRMRVGGGAKYEDGKLLLRGEYITGKTGVLKSEGFYVMAGYFFIPKLQGVVKYDYFQEDKYRKATRSVKYVVGLNYTVIGKTRLQLNYTYRDNQEEGGSNYVVAQIFAAF